jgi:monoamine oxidase
VYADVAMGVEDGVHFCGEHTSVEVQGFMEGAAESGARAAAEVLRRAGVEYPRGLQRVMAARREAGSDAADPEWLHV